MQSDKNLTLILLDYEEGRLRLSGQHEELVVVRADGRVERIDTIDLGFPIGLEQDITPFIAQAELHLESGDVVALYTDGVTEAKTPRASCMGLSACASRYGAIAGARPGTFGRRSLTMCDSISVSILCMMTSHC